MNAVTQEYVDRLVRQVHERISRARASATDTVKEVWHLKQQIHLLASAQLQLVAVLLRHDGIPNADIQTCVTSLEAVLRATEDPPVDWSKLAKPEEPEAVEGPFDWSALPASPRAHPPGDAFLQ